MGQYETGIKKSIKRSLIDRSMSGLTTPIYNLSKYLKMQTMNSEISIKKR